MSKRLYVGNIPYTMADADLHAIFVQHGPVLAVQVVIDRETGQSKGFAFVDMEKKEHAEAAIEALDGQEVAGRRLTVNEARPREPRGGPRR